jgi:hypothetical protein
VSPKVRYRRCTPRRSPSPPLQIAAREEAKALLVRGLARMETVDGVPDEYIVALACGAERDVKGTGSPGPLGDEGRDVKRLTTLR